MKNLFFKNYCRKFLIFFALSIVVATLTFSLCACDDNSGGDNQPIEIVSSNYEFSADLSPEGKTEFYFTPQFSGDYVVSVNDENATFLIDGVEISEKTVYFSKKEKYDIVFRSSQKSINGSIAPVEAVETTLNIRRDNDFVVKFVPKKTGRYLIDLLDEGYNGLNWYKATTEITVYDKNFDRVDELQSRTYFLQQDEKDRCYYVVINNSDKYLNISLDLTIGEVRPYFYVFENNTSQNADSIRGKAGDIVYLYALSLQESGVQDRLYISRATLGEDIQITALSGNEKKNLITNIGDDKYQFIEFNCKGSYGFSYIYWNYVRLKIVFINDSYVKFFKTY